MKTMVTDPSFNLRHIRTNLLKETQESMANMIGVSARTYLRYESSNRIPPVVRRALNSILAERGVVLSPPAKAPDRTL